MWLRSRAPTLPTTATPSCSVASTCVPSKASQLRSDMRTSLVEVRVLAPAHMEPRALFSPAHVGCCFAAPSKSLARTMELLKQELTNTANSRGAKPVIVIDDLQGLLASPKDRRMWLADWRSRLTHSLTHSRKHQHMSSSFCDRWCTSARTASCAMWYSHRLIPSLEYPLSQVQQGLRTRHCLLNCCSSS